MIVNTIMECKTDHAAMTCMWVCLDNVLQVCYKCYGFVTGMLQVCYRCYKVGITGVYSLARHEKQQHILSWINIDQQCMHCLLMPST